MTPRWDLQLAPGGDADMSNTVLYNEYLIEALDKSLMTSIILPDCRESSESMASNCRSGYYTVTVRTLAADRLEGYAERGSGPQGRAKLGAREDLEGSNRKKCFSQRGHRGRNC